MKTFVYIFLFLSILWACKKTDIQPNTNKITLLGEWRYVGKFNTAADYLCYVCPNFDYEKSIYKVIFKEDGSFDIRINLLIGKGNYTGKPNVNATAPLYYGDVSITNLQILNKPFETETDSEFQQRFREVKSFYQSTKTDNPFGYDELHLFVPAPNKYSGADYLIFVRKK